MTNKDFYERSKGFSGNIEDWYRECVKPTDLFRMWFLNEEDECYYYYITNILKIGDNNYILGLLDFNCEENKEMIFYQRLDKISSFELVVNEENI